MFRATLYPSSGADDLVVFLLACFHVLLGGLLWLMVSAVVYRCDLMCKLNNLHTCGCVGGQIRLAGCVSNGEYVAQLALLVWGSVGWMARSKSGFGLPGDCLEMRFLYTVSTPTYFSVSTSSSGSLILLLC